MPKIHYLEQQKISMIRKKKGGASLVEIYPMFFLEISFYLLVKFITMSSQNKINIPFNSSNSANFS
jgi:hypothetical protein